MAFILPMTVPARSLSRIKPVLRILGIIFILYVAFVALVFFRQRSLLFFPSHTTFPTSLEPWSDGSHPIGSCWEVPHPQTIWLMMHGNGGQAAHRDYVLNCLSDKDSLYVLEYPGYGAREGSPSLTSINQAATEAYRLLRTRNPSTPICALGESIGSGPACALAQEKVPPDKIVLVVPYESLAKLAAQHYPILPVRLLLLDAWDNAKSLSSYRGPIDIYGASDDTIIPMVHAKALAKQVPQAHFAEIPGGHNDWSQSVVIRR